MGNLRWVMLEPIFRSLETNVHSTNEPLHACVIEMR